MKLGSVDPRAWNIVAGLGVASGCGDRTIGADASGTATDTTTTQSSQSSTAETGEPECESADDCPDGYYCYYGICMYSPPPDGNWQTDCYVDLDCGLFGLCNDPGYCELLPSPASCPAPGGPSPQIPVQALSLSFVDVDADGAQELVVVTPTELHVYESASDMPLISPRGIESEAVDALVGGAFDAMAGEDVVILLADELLSYSSDGVGNFMAANMTPVPLPDSTGLLAREFDGADPSDLLIWGDSGGVVSLGSGGTLYLSVDEIDSATARSLDDPLGGVVLRHGSTLDFYTSAGGVIASSQTYVAPLNVMTSIADLGDSYDLSASLPNQGWTLIEQWGPGTGNLGSRWGLPSQVTAMLGADFDGDTQADVAVLVDGTVQIHFDVLGDTSCLAQYSFTGLEPFENPAAGLAVGDHDGDGDDELAVRFAVDHVALVDGE